MKDQLLMTPAYTRHSRPTGLDDARSKSRASSLTLHTADVVTDCGLRGQLVIRRHPGADLVALVLLMPLPPGDQRVGPTYFLLDGLRLYPECGPTAETIRCSRRDLHVAVVGLSVTGLSVLSSADEVVVCICGFWFRVAGARFKEVCERLKGRAKTH